MSENTLNSIKTFAELETLKNMTLSEINDMLCHLKDENTKLKAQLALRTKQRDEAMGWNWFDSENIPDAPLAFIEGDE